MLGFGLNISIHYSLKLQSHAVNQVVKAEKQKLN